MAQLTAYLDRRYRPGGFSWFQNWVVNNTSVVYIGSFCGIPNRTAGGLTTQRGYASIYQNQQQMMFIGVCVRTNYESTTDLTSNKVTGATGNTPPPEAWCEGGPIVYEQYAVAGLSAQSDLGKPVYLINDNDMQLTAGQGPSIGRICYWYSATSADVLTYGFLGAFASQTVI